jgi:anti-anti-sigma regulatory factor
MTNAQSEIPLANDDGLTPVFAVPASLTSERPGDTTSLETARRGLLAGPPKTRDQDRRMEEWIASNLDLDLEYRREPRSAWTRLIDGLPGMKRPIKAKPRQRGVETSMLGWSRFRVAYKRGVTVVRLSDKNLARESQVRELACDLLDLIEAGNHRVVLNFQGVERLASWVVVAVEEARRMCEAADGGALKICGLPLQLASIFPIAGVEVVSALYANEATAIDSPWPQASHPRELPIEILSAIIRGADIPPIRGGAPTEAAQHRQPPAESGSTTDREPCRDWMGSGSWFGSVAQRGEACPSRDRGS